MSDIIQLLPDHVANQIAAGEVVQRPASVVKELLENSIDAGATHIHLIVKNAGKTLIQVIDNGKGMSETDARLCFERHATSKIREAQDLFNLNTKGFRGEAMASIAAVAQIEMKTKLDDQDLGIAIKIEANKVLDQEVVQCTKGTNTSVKNLFFNIPARRNFLKSDAVETRHIIDEFQRVALVHHDIHFVMNHNNSEVFNLPKGNLKQRIVGVFGQKTNERLIPIHEETDIITLEGFIVKPEFAKKKRGEQFFFVNDRFIKSPYLHHAINSAFENLMEKSHFPGYFLYLRVPNESIDINIHPTKTEVKFDNERALFEIVRATVKHSLGQYSISPSLDFQKNQNLETPYAYKNKPVTKTPQITVDRNFNPFESEISVSNTNSGGSSSSSTKSFSSAPKVQKPQDWQALYNGLESNVNKMEVNNDELHPELFENQKTDAVNTTYQLYKKYIIAHLKTNVVLVHQHLAHQRVLYEQFLSSITVKEAASQQLLFPISVHFSVQELEIIKNLQGELENTGFMFEEITDDKVIVKGIPVSITESQINMVFEQLIEDFQMDVSANSFSHLDMIAKSLSKTLAIKTGTKLNDIERENLINQLFNCKEPKSSPFGKKVFTHLNTNKVDTLFNA